MQFNFSDIKKTEYGAITEECYILRLVQAGLSAKEVAQRANAVYYDDRRDVDIWAQLYRIRQKGKKAARYYRRTSGTKYKRASR